MAEGRLAALSAELSRLLVEQQRDEWLWRLWVGRRPGRKLRNSEITVTLR
jgi:hypothetical protein